MAFVYAGDLATSSPAQHLAGNRGVLQTDGYSAYKALAKGGAVELAFCRLRGRPTDGAHRLIGPIRTASGGGRLLAAGPILYGSSTKTADAAGIA